VESAVHTDECVAAASKKYTIYTIHHTSLQLEGDSGVQFYLFENVPNARG
jgi:hypothetical protein